MTAHGSAHGKCILIGEHSVVHGTPAIAMPVGLHVDVEVGEGPPLPELPAAFIEWFRGVAMARAGAARTVVSATGDLPQGAGLGSSAALSVAALRALEQAGAPIGDDLVALADEAERIFHGNPSGIDVRAVCAQTPIIYRRSADGPQIETLRPGDRSWWFELWMTPPGLPTAQVVARVTTALEQGCRDASLREAEALVSQARDALDQGDLIALGDAMTGFHGWLARHGASTPLLDELVETALRAGAVGAKLTGGGGGGTMIVLLPDAAWQTPDLPPDVRQARFRLTPSTQGAQ